MEAEELFIRKAASKMLEVLAREHDFDIEHLTTSEAHRLEGFLDTLEQHRYPAFDGWDNKLFSAARLTCRIDLQSAKYKAGIAR
jgi:hypothetical protein